MFAKRLFNKLLKRRPAAPPRLHVTPIPGHPHDYYIANEDDPNRPTIVHTVPREAALRSLSRS